MSDPNGPENKTAEIDAGHQHISHRLKRNMATEVGSRFATAALSLVTVPIVIGKIGVVGYGVWETMLAIAALATLFQGAITGTLLWSVSHAHAKAEVDRVERVIGMGISATLLLTCVLLPAAILIRHWLIAEFNVPKIFLSAVGILLPWVVGALLLGGINECLSAGLGGAQRMAQSSFIRTSALAMNYIVAIICLFFGLGLWSMAVGQTVSICFSSVALVSRLRKFYPGIAFHPIVPQMDELRGAGHYCGYLAIGYVSAALRDQTDRVVLATRASPLWAGYYGIAARLNTLILEFNRYFYMPLVPAVAALHAKGDTEAIHKLYAKFMLATGCFTGAMAILVLGLYDRLMVLWFGHYMPQVTTILMLLVAGSFTQVVLTGPGSAICRGIGRVKIETAYTSANLILNAILTVILVLKVGPLGTVIASVSTVATTSVLFVIVLHSRIGIPYGALKRTAGCVLAVFCTVYLLRWISPNVTFPATRKEALVSTIMLAVPAMLFYGSLLMAMGVIPLKFVRSYWLRVRSMASA